MNVYDVTIIWMLNNGQVYGNGTQFTKTLLASNINEAENRGIALAYTKFEDHLIGVLPVGYYYPKIISVNQNKNIVCSNIDYNQKLNNLLNSIK